MSARVRSVPPTAPHGAKPTKGSGPSHSAQTGRFTTSNGGTTRTTVFPGGHTSVSLKKGLVTPSKDGHRK